MSRPTTADDEAAVAHDDHTAGEDGSGHDEQVLIDGCVSPEVCDERGHLRAATVFEWMEVTGALAASRYGRLRGVPVAIDGCDLHEPVPVGARVAMRATPVYTSRHTLGVSVVMTATDRGDATPRRALSAYLTFAFPGDSGLSSVAPLTPVSSAEVLLHREGDMRRQFHRELSRDRTVLSRPELLLVGAAPDARRDTGVYYLLRELGSRMATRRRRTGAGVRAPEVSYVHRIEPVRASEEGGLHAGALLRWIETCASMSASAFVEAAVRLVGVHGIAFLRPVPGSVYVHLDGAAVHSDDDGVTVHVTASAENPLTGDTREVMRGFMTYAPVEADVSVPAVARPGPAEAALFCEVSLRKALRDRIVSLQRPRSRGQTNS